MVNLPRRGQKPLDSIELIDENSNFQQKNVFWGQNAKKNDFLPAETGIALAGQKSNLFFLTQWVLLRSLDSKKI